MDYDPRSRRYYVASVRHRTIAEVVNGRVTRELWPRATPGIGAVLGVRVDTLRRVLWATLAGVPQMEGFTPADSTIAALVRVRIADGTIERRWDLPPSPRGHALGDVMLGPAGDVFVTDSNDPVLYRLRPGADTLESIRHPLFRSLQGMAAPPNENVLYVADYSHGLLRVDLPTRAVTRLDGRLEDLGWLPSSAWEDERMTAFVPSRYTICLIHEKVGLHAALGSLPARADDLLRTRNRTARDFRDQFTWCLIVAARDARRLARILDAARNGDVVSRDTFGLVYELSDRDPETTDVQLGFSPSLPDEL